jgi:hypothetical protein
MIIQLDGAPASTKAAQHSITKTRTAEIRTLTPDQLLDLIATEQDQAS